MHRPGMRFDRRHVVGTPDAGFIGTDIDVVTLTGSVMPSLEQRYQAYEITNRPQVIGYPRGWEDMFEATNRIYNSGVTLTWGHGFDVGGADSYRSNFVPNGGGTGVDSWNFSAFTTDGYWWNPTLYVDMGGKWQALTKWKGVPTFITASSIESSLGPRGMMDLGTIPAVSGSSADVDYAIRLMTTSSFLYTTVPNFYAGGYGRAAVVVFKYSDTTASFDIHSFGRLDNDTSVSCLSVVTGNLRWSASSSQGLSHFSVPVEPDTWYISLALNSQFGSDNRVWLGAVPFWGGETQIISTAALGGYFNSVTGSYIGDCGFFRASDTLRVAAVYMGSVGPAGIGDPVAPPVTASLPVMQRSFSAQARTKFKSTNAIGDSLTAFGTDLERRYLDQKLLGLGTGALGRSFGVATITTGSIPSWTNSHIRNSAFVSTTLSSSNHESQVLNFYRSGTEGLEQTRVPASATLYYSKKSVSKVTVKKTASFFDTLPRTTAGHGIYGEFVPWTYVAGSGSDFTNVSGSTNGTYSVGNGLKSTPAHIYVDVPVSGKLIDIAVWVELHHHSTSLTDAMPLSSVAIALKSPGVKSGVADPVIVDNGVAGGFGGSDLTDIFTKDSFILWEGSGQAASDQAVWVDNGTFGPNPYLRERLASWDRDFSMRTIFHDGAPVKNPRHNVGITSASGNYDGSPNAALGFNNAWGFNTFWTGSAGSPPAGWLNGAGGVAAVNEWATTGSNRGAERMKPLYPMLDPIEVVFDQPTPGVTYVTTVNGRPVTLPGLRTTRAGLRGTEISGTWKLLLAGQMGDLDDYNPVYFRQVRLEITYEDHKDTANILRSDSPVRPRRQGIESIYQITTVPLPGTSASYSISINNTPDGEIGRTFGIGLNTGSINQSSYALIYRLTGTLADLSGTTPGWLLNNEFGMPRIPISSASLVEADVTPITSIHPQDILATRPLLDGAQRLADAARDASRPQTRAEYAVELITGSLI